jgi:hypothetical protein
MNTVSTFESVRAAVNYLESKGKDVLQDKDCQRSNAAAYLHIIKAKVMLEYDMSELTKFVLDEHLRDKLDRWVIRLAKEYMKPKSPTLKVINKTGWKFPILN